jgi:hypothetical protein
MVKETTACLKRFAPSVPKAQSLNNSSSDQKATVKVQGMHTFQNVSDNLVRLFIV